MCEYDVWWNGVNNGHDGDLLQPVDRIAEKLSAPKLPKAAVTPGRPPQGGRIAMEAEYGVVRAALLLEPMTRLELRVRYRYSVKQVDVALARCRRAGLLHHIDAQNGLQGRPAQKYWIDPEE